MGGQIITTKYTALPWTILYHHTKFQTNWFRIFWDIDGKRNGEVAVVPPSLRSLTLARSANYWFSIQGFRIIYFPLDIQTFIIISLKKIFKIWFSKQNSTLNPMVFLGNFRNFIKNLYYFLNSSNHISRFRNLILLLRILLNTYYW